MSLWAQPLSACGSSPIPDLLNVSLLFALLSQDLCQGSEEHAVAGQLPGAQHEVPAGETHGECDPSTLPLSTRDPLQSIACLGAKPGGG